MTVRSNKVLLSVAAVLAMAAAGSANATNGYLTHGVGTQSKGIAGSGVADPQEVAIVASNPAGIAFVGERLELGLAMFSPVRDYETSSSLYEGQGGTFTIGPNSIGSENELFFIPYVAKSWKRDEQNTIALSFYARGGMNTEWRGGDATFDPDGPGPAPVTTYDGTYGGSLFGEDHTTAGVDLMQGFLNTAYAWNNAERTVSVGAAAIIGIQRFRAVGVSAFAPYTKTFAESGGTVLPANLSNNGYDWGYGIGGIAFRPNAGLTFTAGLQQIYYEGIPSVSNPIQSIFACPTAGQGGTDLESCLGGKHGAGFGWEDMTVYSLGAAWKYGEDWTFRVGASTTDQPIPEDQMTFNILAPGVMEEHYTIGFTKKLDSGHDFSMSFMYAPSVKVSGPQNFDPSQTVTFEMDQWDLEFSYAWGK